MYYITDEINKVVFGWSAKCGCSHIKNMFWFLKSDSIDNELHIPAEYKTLPKDISNYTVIMFVRNPYNRVVSGFLHTGCWSWKWKTPNNILFSHFVDELITNKFDQIDHHHFEPQVNGYFHYKEIIKSKKKFIYDINNIDYKNIEKIYNKTIPESVLNFKGTHINKTTKNFESDKKIYDLNLEEYSDYKVPIQSFFNDDIKNKIYNFYKGDFLFCKDHGIDYVL